MLRAVLLAVLVSFLAPAVARAADTRVYFTKGEQLAYVTRDLESGPAAALTALLDGPTAAEQKKGYGSAIPPAVTLTSAKITGERVDVVLAGPLETAEPMLHARLAQLVYTATAGTDVTDVRVLGKTTPARTSARSRTPSPSRRPRRPPRPRTLRTSRPSWRASATSRPTP